MVAVEPVPGTDVIRMRSTAFEDYTRMPAWCAFEHDNVPPPLEWDGVPTGTAELVLICADLDAADGGFVHWVVTGIPPTATGHDGTPGVLGSNGSGDVAWGGPHPPLGEDVHRYVFHLFAADRPLRLAEGATADEVHAALDGHVLASGSIVGLYVR